MSLDRRIRWIPVLLLAGSSVLTACGGSDDAASDASAEADPAAAAGEDEHAGMEGMEPEADRVIEVSMTDNEFTPSNFTVEQGETVTFEFTNNGSVTHEAVIGDEEGQKIHGEDLADDGQHSHESGLHGPAARGIEPGETGEVTYTFEEDTELLIGCHEPDHYETMKATIEVV